jgi:hypothetical protein
LSAAFSAEHSALTQPPSAKSIAFAERLSLLDPILDRHRHSTLDNAIEVNLGIDVPKRRATLDERKRLVRALLTSITEVAEESRIPMALIDGLAGTGVSEQLFAPARVEVLVGRDQLQTIADSLIGRVPASCAGRVVHDACELLCWGNAVEVILWHQLPRVRLAMGRSPLSLLDAQWANLVERRDSARLIYATRELQAAHVISEYGVRWSNREGLPFPTLYPISKLLQSGAEQAPGMDLAILRLTKTDVSIVEIRALLQLTTQLREGMSPLALWSRPEPHGKMLRHLVLRECSLRYAALNFAFHAVQTYALALQHRMISRSLDSSR